MTNDHDLTRRRYLKAATAGAAMAGAAGCLGGGGGSEGNSWRTQELVGNARTVPSGSLDLRVRSRPRPIYPLGEE
jgi:nitrous oxide reductase